MKCDCVQLSDVCNLVSGFAFKSKDFGCYDDKVIKIADITPPRVKMNSLNGVDVSKYDKDKIQKFMANTGDYVLAMTGATIGKVGRIEKGSAYINQRVLLFRPKVEIDKDYLYYLICQKSFYNYILNFVDSETAQPNISAKTIGQYRIKLPCLEIRRKIGACLRKLDQKIELNNKISDNLSEQLQTIYQQRFGDESFTTELGTLADICTYSKDRVPVATLTVGNYYSTENMLQGKAGAVEATTLPTTSQTTACHIGDTLVSNIRPYFKKIVYCENDCGCSADVLCFKPIEARYSSYLFSTLYADRFFDFMMAGAKGTKMPRGDKQQIMTYPIAIPSSNELDVFNSVAVPILAQIRIKHDENKRLSTLRDALLPKFMSGEIDVSNIQI